MFFFNLLVLRNVPASILDHLQEDHVSFLVCGKQIYVNLFDNSLHKWLKLYVKLKY